METKNARVADGAAIRVIEDVLTIFRGHRRGHRPEWVDISGRRVPLVDAGALSMILMTPFQRVDLSHSPGRHSAWEESTYGIDVFAGKQVFSASWDATVTRVDLLAPGPWRAQVSRMAAATTPTVAEVALRLATMRAAVLLSHVYEAGGGVDPTRRNAPVSEGGATRPALVPGNATPVAAP